jgi:hypothetical protein
MSAGDHAANAAPVVASITNLLRANGLAADGIAGASTMAKIHQQMITGDSQMWPTALPVKPANTTPASTPPRWPTLIAMHGKGDKSTLGHDYGRIVPPVLGFAPRRTSATVPADDCFLCAPSQAA